MQYKDIQGIIANNIKNLRKASGFTQQDVADAISIDVSVYNRIENGKIMASHDKLYSLAKLYRISIEKFYEGLGSNVQNNYDNSQVNSNFQINYNKLDSKLISELKEIKEYLKSIVENTGN